MFAPTKPASGREVLQNPAKPTYFESRISNLRPIRVSVKLVLHFVICCVFMHSTVTDDVGAAIAYRAPGAPLKSLALATILSVGLITAPALSNEEKT